MCKWRLLFISNSSPHTGHGYFRLVRCFCMCFWRVDCLWNLLLHLLQLNNICDTKSAWIFLWALRNALWANIFPQYLHLLDIGLGGFKVLCVISCCLSTPLFKKPSPQSVQWNGLPSSIIMGSPLSSSIFKLVPSISNISSVGWWSPYPSSSGSILMILKASQLSSS